MCVDATFIVDNLFDRYENAFSMKTEDRYSSALNRTDAWESPTDNAIEDIPSVAKDSSSDKYVSLCSLHLQRKFKNWWIIILCCIKKLTFLQMFNWRKIKHKMNLFHFFILTFFFVKLLNNNKTIDYELQSSAIYSKNFPKWYNSTSSSTIGYFECPKSCFRLIPQEQLPLTRNENDGTWTKNWDSYTLLFDFYFNSTVLWTEDCARPKARLTVLY